MYEYFVYIYVCLLHCVKYFVISYHQLKRCLFFHDRTVHGRNKQHLSLILSNLKLKQSEEERLHRGPIQMPEMSCSLDLILMERCKLEVHKLSFVVICGDGCLWGKHKVVSKYDIKSESLFRSTHPSPHSHICIFIYSYPYQCILYYILGKNK